MQLIKPTYLPSHEVESWSSIKDQAMELATFIEKKDYGIFKGGVYAIHHMQVCENNPFDFFVLNKEVLPKIVEELGSEFIINAKVESHPNFVMKMKEGCASFPHKSMKNVERYHKILASFQIPTAGGGLEKRIMELTGIVAEIFQHEIDHGKGKNIYYDTIAVCK